MPTVSAAQALEALGEDASRHISTSLPDLDLVLAGGSSGLHLLDSQKEKGGIQRGQVTEFWGPPGVGKTSFGYVQCAVIEHSGIPVSDELIVPKPLQMCCVMATVSSG